MPIPQYHWNLWHKRRRLWTKQQTVNINRPQQNSAQFSCAKWCPFALSKFYCLLQGTPKRDARSTPGYMGLVATTWVPTGAELPVLSPIDHPNLYQGCQKGLEKALIFRKFSRGTQQPKQRQFRGHGKGYMGLPATIWVPMGAQVAVLSPNDHPSPSQRRQKDFEKKNKCRKLSSATKQPKQQLFHGFTTWVLMGAQILVLSQNDHPNPSRGDRKSRTFEHFQVPPPETHRPSFDCFRKHGGPPPETRRSTPESRRPPLEA